MEKITNADQLNHVYGDGQTSQTARAMRDVGVAYGYLNNENFWQIREQCRINDGTYTPIHIDGDLKTRFLHVSVDDPAKVSYTKDADKGKQDIQTRTTLAAYCEKFGLEMPQETQWSATDPEQAEGRVTRDDPTAKQMAQAMNVPRIGTTTANTLAGLSLTQKDISSANSVKGRLNLIQHLIDEVLADLG